MIITYDFNMQALSEALGSQGDAQHFLTELSDALREEIINDV